jgi:hypothetical protein
MISCLLWTPTGSFCLDAPLPLSPWMWGIFLC